MKLEAANRLRVTGFSLRQTPLQAALVQAGFLSKIKALPGLGAKAKNALVHEMKSQVHEVSENLGITKEAVVLAFKEPKMSHMLEACGYSFATMWGVMHTANKLAEHGALHVIAHFSEHVALHKVVHHSAHKTKVIDNFLHKYPVLKKVTGPAIAGMLLYGYTLTEPRKLGEWDLGNVAKALKGEFGIQDFLQTSEALYLGTHVASGKALSLSAFAENATTLVLGLTCTAIQQSSNPQLRELAHKIQASAAKFRSKKTPLASIEESKSFKGQDVLKRIAKDKSVSVHAPVAPTVRPGSEDAPGEDTGKSKSEKWWDGLSDEAQHEYLGQHPASKLKPHKANKHGKQAT